MSTTKAVARRAGILYFVFMIVAIVAEFLLPGFLVPGDAAATARNIATSHTAYRFDILLNFVTLLVFIYLVSNLYRLFRDVDRGHARTMVLLVAIGIAVSLARLLVKFAPLVVLNEADHLSAFTTPQLEAITLGALRFHAAGAPVSTMFWGLWLFPFGVLVIRSGFIPRLLGVLLLVAGAAYVVSSVTTIALPELRSAIARIVFPLYFGEVPIIFWLLFKGARAPRVPAASSQVLPGTL